MIENEYGLQWENWLNKWFYKFLLIGICINASGLFITIFDPDAALYASIAKAMVQSGDFINLKVQGLDWLDKPHFPFWMAAISFKIFGIHTFAYKLPAIVFWGIGLWYTWRFALSLYKKPVAQLAALMYVSAAHLVISNNDVRAEPYLTGLIIGSVYHFYRAAEKKFSSHLIAGAFFAACAIMTKGPFVLITIGAGFLLEWIIKAKWAEFGKGRWWVALLLVAIFILPELFCVYTQFDLHPEKIIFGKTGVSGIRFFFWDSQIGRFFNTGPIKGTGDKFFYFHTLLWAFLPWSFLFVAAIVWRIKNTKQNSTNKEYVSIGSATVTFLLFSFSSFQLPHYLNILFPFFAVITAQYIYSIKQPNTIKRVKWIQASVGILLVSFILLVSALFKFTQPYVSCIWVAAILSVLFILFKRDTLANLFGHSFLTTLLVYGFLNLLLYPAILKYQAGSEAAFYINSLDTNEKVFQYNEECYSFTFYLQHKLSYWGNTKMKNNNGSYLIFTKKDNLSQLSKQGIQVAILKEFSNFHISQLSAHFINYKTRPATLQQYVVARITPLKIGAL
jgi:4-amino-4-deoxy-L-arabinose transferase-like glycosyltransferase